MHATCLHCHRHLGRNEQIEVFPIGKRLAFDERRGRLWVVCRRCRRWNLTPLEERWEAIEACERLFRAARRRVSTDQIGLAKLTGGLDLIRIGNPIRPEFAAWRYGSEFIRRRRRDLATGLATAIAGTAGLAGVTAAAALSVGLGGALVPVAVFTAGSAWVTKRETRRIVARPSDGAGRPAVIRVKHLPGIRFLPTTEPATLRLLAQADPGEVEIAGADALRVAALACAHRNQIGASPRVVRVATAQLEEAGGAEGVLRRAATVGALKEARYVERLALEMALHEEAERRALAGELAELERAWRDAEEIAALADNLLLPEAIHTRLAQLQDALAGAGRA